MTPKAPSISDAVGARLAALGRQIRARRRALNVTMVATAEAAGLSRVTLHRIERGEPSVAMGAYVSVLDALGLGLELADLSRPREAETLPAVVRLDDYPQLAAIAWQRDNTTELLPEEALNLYERNWRHIDHEAMAPRERALIELLVKELSGGRALVRT